MVLVAYLGIFGLVGVAVWLALDMLEEAGWLE